MTVERYLPVSDGGEIEESIRVDQQVGDEDSRRLKLLDDFRVTDAAEDFLDELLDRLLGQGEGSRRGWNHWLYGYYGSGKSHLLALCGALLDSEWVEVTGREEVWSRLAGSGTRLPELRERWEGALDGHQLRPLSLNLLKYQGVRDRSLSSLLVNAAHREAGLSAHPEIAEFENWYRDTDAWDEREERASAVLEELGVEPPPSGLWERIRRYPAVAHLVLPRLFEEEMGQQAGFYDLAPTEIRPGQAVQELEDWRRELSREHGEPTKLILLLDEVSLFVGAQYQLVTELQALAENIDEQGGGEILSVVTAQARIQDVAPEAARHRVDFSILKDRFPHQYHLPSRHVGEIVQGRLLTKDEDHRERLQEEVLGEESVQRARDTLVYREVAQNTTPPLDGIDPEQLLDYYPFLPYQLPLFLEVLHGLREDVADRAKSIFSGTARAALAVASSLLDEWRGNDDPYALVSLPGFYDRVRRELESAIPGKVKTIRDIEDEVEVGGLEEFDLKVAKAVLLLGFVDQMIDSTRVENLAVAVMDRLDGRGLLETANRVDDALTRLDTYIRKPEATEERSLRFTGSEEREILREARALEAENGWGRLLSVVGEELWPDLMNEVGLPNELPYSEDDDLWPVSYSHRLDGHDLTEPETTGALHLEVHVHDLLPEGDRGADGRPDVVWTVGDEGKKKALETLRSWASLAEATTRHRTPASIEDDLAVRKSEALSAVAALIRSGTFEAGPHRPSNLDGALRAGLAEKYPSHYHPVMTEVGPRELESLSSAADRDVRPGWVQALQIPVSETDEELGPVAGFIRGRVGRAVKQQGPLSVHRLLGHLEDSEETYRGAAVRPALAAVLWGLCRRGDFRPIDPEGRPVETEAILASGRWDETRLALEENRSSVRDALERLPEVDPTDDLTTMRLKLAERLESLEQRAAGLRRRVGDRRDDLLSEPGSDLLVGFGERLEKLTARGEQLHNRASGRTPDWSQVVADALDASDLLEKARQRWDEREAFLLHLDGLLAVGGQPPDWVSGTTREGLETTAQEIAEHGDVPWWSSGGWSSFRDGLSVLDEVRDGLREDWEAFLESADRRRLGERLKGHPWMKGAYELPPRLVRTRLEREVLQPLRRFDRQCGRGQKVMDRLCSSPADRQVGELEEVLDLLEGDAWYPKASDERVQKLTSLFGRLHALVGDLEPGSVPALGLWRADERPLRDALLELTTDRELTVEPVDGDLRVS
jgi:hypothetical protein